MKHPHMRGPLSRLTTLKKTRHTGTPSLTQLRHCVKSKLTSTMKTSCRQLRIFIVTTTFPNVTNWVNLFVFTLQFASYFAVSVSVIEVSSSTNPCNFPANVTSPVRATQLLSMMYSILVQDSIVKSLYTIRNGYDEAELRRCFPDCAQKRLKIRWII
jgi:hypothetical protein